MWTKALKMFLGCVRQFQSLSSPENKAHFTSTCRFCNRHPVTLASRFQIEDEGPEPEKKILVLGLENSGKSSILAQFTAPHNTNSAIAKVTPTQGFNAVNLINDGVSLKIYERKFIV